MSDHPGSLLRSLSSGAQYLVVAAPYIKVDALTTVLEGVSPTASVICITRWNPHDLITRVSDLESRTIVNERGGSFRLHPSLHAKYYRIDDEVLIGSANLTSSAMGWSFQPNLEILCRAGDDFDACVFERTLLKNSREVSDDEFVCWEAINKFDSHSSGTTTGDQPRLAAWRPSTRDTRHLEIAYRGQEDEIASSDEQRAALRDIQTLLIPPSLTDEQVRMWASACLLAAPFTNAVIQLRGMDVTIAARLLAETYNLGSTEARRDMETVHNWLAVLAPEVLKEPLES